MHHFKYIKTSFNQYLFENVTHPNFSDALKDVESTTNTLEYCIDNSIIKKADIKSIANQFDEVKDPNINGFNKQIGKGWKNATKEQIARLQYSYWISVCTERAIAEAYHKAKADGSNPELVKAVEELLGAKESKAIPLQTETESKAITEPTKQGKQDEVVSENSTSVVKQTTADIQSLNLKSDESGRKDTKGYAKNISKIFGGSTPKNTNTNSFYFTINHNGKDYKIRVSDHPSKFEEKNNLYNGALNLNGNIINDYKRISKEIFGKDLTLFNVGDNVTHFILGNGVVTKINDNGTIHIVFENGKEGNYYQDADRIKNNSFSNPELVKAVEELLGKSESKATTLPTEAAPLNDNFFKWFGKSKASKNNKPIILFHGTKTNFDIFKPSKSIGNQGETDQLEGMYFTDNKEAASFFALNYDDRFIKSVYLSLQNPYIVESNNELKSKLGITKLADANKKLKELGYDGIIMKNGFYAKGGPFTLYLAFYPNQIKSINNDGTWDIDDNNINS